MSFSQFQRIRSYVAITAIAAGAFVGQVARMPYTADYFFYRENN
jgi:hypothetical protein